MTVAPRALVLSERNAESRKWHAFQYEFEDVAAAVDDVALLAPPERPVGKPRYVLNRAVRFAGHPERYSEPAMRPVRIARDYDLFFATFSFASDIPHLLQLRDLQKRCARKVCFIVELFTQQIAQARPYLELLRRFEFDQVFLFNPAPRDAVAEIVGCPVDFLGLGVDALRFSPYPQPPARCVDFYQFGRRSSVTHDAVLDMAARDGTYYVYDTIHNVPLPDYRPHRVLMAETLKRTRYFFAYRAGEDLERVRADDALSSRYYEGGAGGAVLLGSHPHSAQWEDQFGWPDAVIDIPYDAHDLREIIAELETQPERLARASTSNVLGALRRHDWSYRWARVLEAAGLPPRPALTARMERLESLAAMAEAA
jgi:hypothetical protein